MTEFETGEAVPRPLKVVATCSPAPDPPRKKQQECSKAA